MGSKRLSGPRRTVILSSLVWLSRGPWIFRSCFPRTTVISSVSLPARPNKIQIQIRHRRLSRNDPLQSTNTFTALFAWQKSERAQRTFDHTPAANTTQAKEQMQNSDIQWNAVLLLDPTTYLRCLRWSRRAGGQRDRTPPQQCWAGRFCVAATAAEPEDRMGWVQVRK